LTLTPIILTPIIFFNFLSEIAASEFLTDVNHDCGTVHNDAVLTLAKVPQFFVVVESLVQLMSAVVIGSRQYNEEATN
jgi:hypothetical protein